MTHDQNLGGSPLPRPLTQIAADALPADALAAWKDLALAVVSLHPNAPAALRHAYDAAVDPLQFANIQLGTWPGQEGLDLPVLSFGPKAEQPCRRFGSQGEIAPQPLVGPWSSDDARAAEWITKFRAAGAHFQWMRPGEEVVWIGVPVEQLDQTTPMFDALSLADRCAVVAIVKPILRANGGFF